MLNLERRSEKTDFCAAAKTCCACTAAVDPRGAASDRSGAGSSAAYGERVCCRYKIEYCRTGYVGVHSDGIAATCAGPIGESITGVGFCRKTYNGVANVSFGAIASTKDTGGRTCDRTVPGAA